VGERCDVIVVGGGGGGAGLMAAWSAARLGRRVVLLEKNPQLGGTTALSVGSISTTATPHQRAQGIVDTPEAHFEDMATFAGPLANRDNLELRRLLVEEVPATFRALMDAGITFMGPMPEPPHRQPRLHAIVPHSKGYIHHLAKACRRHGVDLRTDHRVVELVLTDGRVTGVKAVSSGGRESVLLAGQGVILASGDFSNAATEYKGRFLDPALMPVEGINATSTGDGQRLGEAVGGEVVNGDLVWGPEIRFVAPGKASPVARLPPWRPVAETILWGMRTLPDAVLRPFLMGFVTTFLAPSHGLFAKGAILVNREGRRFCDERDRPELAISGESEGVAYILLDGAIASAFEAWPNFVSTAPGVGYAYLADYRRSRRDITVEASSLGDLAGKLGIDAAALEATVRAYNTSAERGDRPALTRPPYVAMGPAKSWIVFSEGGLRIDRRFRVLDRRGEPISGLFAAGSAGQGGVILNGHGHHLGWAFTSGRLAGQSAALAAGQQD
jgi:fumarate reductase flavoprotein subunit